MLITNSILFFPCTAGAPYSLLLLNNVYGLVCDGSLNHEVVEGDDPLEICVRISGSEGERVEVNVITVDGTATGTYVLKSIYIEVKCVLCLQSVIM